MARIIPLHGAGEHDEVVLLLPWYVTGRLDPLEHARVETHLAACAECQAELRFERRLQAEVAELPVDLERGWADLRSRIATPAPARRTGGPRRDRRPTRRRPGWMWGAIAAQLVMLLMLGALTLQGLKAPRYQTLGSSPTPAAGNLVVVFRPETTEQDLRKVLVAADARVVDGPTAAGAYVLHVAAKDRIAALAQLRGQASVVLAQPIDADGPP